MKLPRVDWTRSLSRLVILAIALEPLVEGLGYFGKFEGLASFAVAHMKSQSAQPSPVVVVKITPDDLEQPAFASVRPFKPIALQGVINEILRQMLATAPASPQGSVPDSGILGIDLSTTDPEYASIRTLPGLAVVFGRPAEFSEVNDESYFAAPVLGSPSPQVQWGLSLVGADDDGTVRHFQQFYRVAFPDVPVSTQNSLIANLAWRGNSACGDTYCASGGKYYIDFRHPNRETESVKELFDRKIRLPGKIVLLGDSTSPRDEHKTPMGWKSGVDIIADAIDTDLEILHGSTDFRVRPELQVMGCALLLGLLSWLALRLGAETRFRYYGAGLAAITVALSVWAGKWAFSSAWNFISFLPAILAPPIDKVLGAFKDQKHQ